MSKITENTYVSVGLAIAVIGGGAAWMTKQDFQTTANAAKIEESVQKFDHIERQLQGILQELGIIKGELKRIKR